MLTQNQLQEITRKQFEMKQNGATIITSLGIILVLIASCGFMFTQDVDYVIVLIIGSLVFFFGFINLKY